MDNSSSPEVVIIGAGIAGLTAAKIISKAGKEVLLIESSDKAGGRVRTDKHEGFLLDRGFQVLLTAYPELTRHLDIESLDLKTFEAGATIVKNGHLSRIGDPFRKPSSIAVTALNRNLTVKDKLALLKLRISLTNDRNNFLKGPDDEIVSELFERLNFSKNAINSFLKPLIGGIQLDPEIKGSARLCLLVLKMLFTGTAAVPARGMGSISNQLIEGIERKNILYDSPVSKIEGRIVKLSSGESLSPSTVIVATESPAASELLSCETSSSRSVSCVYFAAREAPTSSKSILLNGGGCGPALDVAIMTNVAPSYSSTNKALIAAAVPGEKKLDDIGPVINQMKRWFGETVNDWQHLRTYSIAHGQPDLKAGDSFRKEIKIREGVFMCGDHRDTPSIQGALVSGRRTAELYLKENF